MPATITSSTARPLYPVIGKNYAPKRNLEELGKPQHSPPNELTEALANKYRDYIDRDFEAYTENCDTGRAVSNLRSGKLLLMRSITDGRYLFVKRDGKFSDNKTVGGKFQFYSTKLTAEWLSSRPERDPICPSDDDQIEEFISAVKIVQDHYDRKFFDTDYETKESHSAQDYGTWITRYYFDKDKDDIVCELLDFPACRWDIRFTAEESSYFIYESKCSTAVLKHLLDAEIASDGEQNQNYGLNLIESLAKTGGNTEGNGKNRPSGTYSNVAGENIVTQMWLQPEAYCDIELPAGEDTIGGTTLSKGSLLKTFPNGMCVVGINGLQTIIGLYAENHKDHIVSGRYHVQSFSGVGKGISDAVDVMKDFNDLRSQILAYVKAHATPGYGYNSAVMSEADARDIGKPRKNIALDFTQAPEGVHSVNDVVQAIVPGNPAAGAFEYARLFENDLQMSFQVTDFTGGLPGVDNKTATGAKIGDANAATILIPQHLNKADHRKRSDVVIYNLFKKYVNKPRWFSTKAKNAITKGQYISGTQFDGVDIDFEIVANSQVPKTPFEERDASGQMFLQTGGAMGFAQLKASDPEFAGELASTYGVKFSVPTSTDIARVCRKRVEQAKKLLQIEERNQEFMSAVGAPADNANLAAAIVSQLVPPISSKEMYQPQKAQWLAALLDSDELQYGPAALRHVIEEMIDRHVQMQTLGAAEVQQDADMANLMANLPMIAGQQGMNYHDQQLQQNFQQQQAQQQMQQQQMQAQQQLQLKGQEAAISDKQSEADHQRALAMNDDQHGKALQLAAVNHLADMQKQKAVAQ